MLPYTNDTNIGPLFSYVYMYSDFKKLLMISLFFFSFSGTEPLRKRLKKGVVPSVFAWTKAPLPSQEARQIRRQARETLMHATPDIDDIQHEMEIEEEPDQDQLHVEQETELSKLVDAVTQTDTEELAPICVERYADNDAVIHMYTGLETFAKFMFVLASLGQAAAQLTYRWGDRPKMSIENQFLMMLIKLRMYKSNEELAVCFKTSTNTVANIVFTWINFAYHQWKEIDIWPVKELVKFYMPRDFRKKFPKTRIILDGTEIPIKKPKKPHFQQVTFSCYKNRNTLKVIVGATPGGLVSHIPTVYGGSASDRALMEHDREFFQKIEPKDEVMVDKGFNIQDLLAPYDVKLSIPTFLRKRNQFKPSSRESDKKIASKRVHIERIIGLAKTYKILTSPLTGPETSIGEQIIFCCFMLCNFRECIVPRTA